MESNRILKIISVFIVIIFAFAWEKIPTTDAINYFTFADQRSFFGIPNTLDILSNLFFLGAGSYGFYQFFVRSKYYPLTISMLSLILSIASILIFAGSTHFHEMPNAQTLFWDRLPMTLAFSSIVGLVIADRVSEKLGVRVFLILAFLGFASVFGMRQAWLDLRPYATLQFGTIVFVALSVLFLRRGRIFSDRLLWTTMFLYVLAKILELYDHQVFQVLGFVSGHTLKHIAAAFAVFNILTFFKNRTMAASEYF